MKTRGCISQRKTTKVRLAPSPGQGSSAGSRPPRPAPARPAALGHVPVELPGAPPPCRNRGTGARTPQEGAENSRPSPSRAGFSGACVSYEIPGEGEKFPKCLLLPRFLSFAWKAQLPCPPRVGEGAPASPNPVLLEPPAGVPGLAWGAAGSARAHPAPGRPSAGAPSGVPLASRCPCSGPRAPGGEWGPSMQIQGSAPLSPLLQFLPLSPAHLHPPTSPLPLTPRVPTPRVFLFAPTCGLAPEDVSV